MTSSRMVAWFQVYEFARPFLSKMGSWPRAGTPPWAALDDNDPRKLAAVLEAGVHWALKIDTLQEEHSRAVNDLREAGSDEGDWTALARIVARGNGARIPRKKAS